MMKYEVIEKQEAKATAGTLLVLKDGRRRLIVTNEDGHYILVDPDNNFRETYGSGKLYAHEFVDMFNNSAGSTRNVEKMYKVIGFKLEEI